MLITLLFTMYFTDQHNIWRKGKQWEWWQPEKKTEARLWCWPWRRLVGLCKWWKSYNWSRTKNAILLDQKEISYFFFFFFSVLHLNFIIFLFLPSCATWLYFFGSKKQRHYFLLLKLQRKVQSYYTVAGYGSIFLKLSSRTTSLKLFNSKLKYTLVYQSWLFSSCFYSILIYVVVEQADIFQ